MYKNNLDYVKDHYTEIVIEPRIQDMFIIAAMKSNIEKDSTFTFLQSVWDIDPLYTNDTGTNCLLSACVGNNNLSMIEYLIVLGMDPDHLDSENDNCLILACWENQNLDIIKFLVNRLMDKYILINDLINVINHTDNSGDNCFMAACGGNNNLEIIKYLATCSCIDINCLDISGKNCLMEACRKNENLEIIKYLVTDLKICTDLIDANGDNCLTLACWKNRNVDVVKYLINDLKMCTNHQDHTENNCLLAACLDNNLSVAEYLIDNINLDINHTNKSGNSGLLIACWNGNFDLIKKILNCEKINVNVTNKGGENCISMACGYKKREYLKVIEYLINNTDIELRLKHMRSETFKEIIWKIPDPVKLNKLMDLGPRKYGMIKMKGFVDTINPFLLNIDNRKRFEINPFEKNYQQVIELVDIVDNKICLEEDCEEVVTVMNTKLVCDFTKKSEFLFKHGSEDYYGHRETVYESILLLKDMKDTMDFTNGLILDGNLPKEIINQYIGSSYTGFFDMECLDKSPEYFIDFLKFIDQYPTIYVSVDKLEKQIIWILNSYVYEDYLYFKNLCNKYQMKRLYVHLHNLCIKN